MQAVDLHTMAMLIAIGSKWKSDGHVELDLVRTKVQEVHHLARSLLDLHQGSYNSRFFTGT